MIWTKICCYIPTIMYFKTRVWEEDCTYLEKGQTLLSLGIKQIKYYQDTIWLHHFHCGYPSYGVLRIMIPSLFKGIDVESFHCDFWDFAEHNRVSFSSSNKSTIVPFFFLIHSDVSCIQRVPFKNFDVIGSMVCFFLR